MLTKIALLLACAMVVWWVTRPRRQRPKKHPPETQLVACAHCGAYYPRGESCDCE